MPTLNFLAFLSLANNLLLTAGLNFGGIPDNERQIPCFFFNNKYVVVYVL